MVSEGEAIAGVLEVWRGESGLGRYRFEGMVKRALAEERSRLAAAAQKPEVGWLVRFPVPSRLAYVLGVVERSRRPSIGVLTGITEYSFSVPLSDVEVLDTRVCQIDESAQRSWNENSVRREFTIGNSEKLRRVMVTYARADAASAQVHYEGRTVLELPLGDFYVRLREAFLEGRFD